MFKVNLCLSLCDKCEVRSNYALLDRRQSLNNLWSLKWKELLAFMKEDLSIAL